MCAGLRAYICWLGFGGGGFNRELIFTPESVAIASSWALGLDISRKIHGSSSLLILSIVFLFPRSCTPGARRTCPALHTSRCLVQNNCTTRTHTATTREHDLTRAKICSSLLECQRACQYSSEESKQGWSPHTPGDGTNSSNSSSKPKPPSHPEEQRCMRCLVLQACILALATVNRSPTTSNTYRDTVCTRRGWSWCWCWWRWHWAPGGSR